MEENKKVDMVRGMFSNCTFNNSVVAGIAESGSQVFYEKAKEEDIEEDDEDTVAHEAIIEYVKRLKPLVKQELQRMGETGGSINVSNPESPLYSPPQT